MAEWSDNDQNYIVNELLRFALSQEEDFQKYKAETRCESLSEQPIPKVLVGNSGTGIQIQHQTRFVINQRTSRA